MLKLFSFRSSQSALLGILLPLLLISAIAFFPTIAFSQATVTSNQVQLPSQKILFNKDSKESKKLNKKKTESAIAVDTAALNRIDFKAPNVQFDKDTNT
ncbi:MAG: hypothetical protein WCK43_09410, partial [bacterium]